MVTFCREHSLGRRPINKWCERFFQGFNIGSVKTGKANTVIENKSIAVVDKTIKDNRRLVSEIKVALSLNKGTRDCCTVQTLKIVGTPALRSNGTCQNVIYLAYE
ncbi:hypothetical protein NPIL_456781 [Nephila pilipes]|uniref:Mos1 transposase HTH domain-containing protein n=1 Tax=Nephila pilipes TaxID=299642 RepID=A0A8X6N3W4_NEPPI|nr:hypothetical protein NPIL_456781 [Nephila pilipes]